MIPDGTVGALATTGCSSANSPSQVQVTDVNGSGATTTLPLNSTQQPDMVLGDQGTYFTTDGTQVIDVNEASGSQVWSWQPNQGTVQIMAATAGGGVTVKNIVGSQEDVVRIDSTGNPTYDTWGTTGGSAAYGVLSNSSYFANQLWVGTTGDPVISGMTGDTLQTANTNWPWGTGGGAGDHEGQAVGPPALKLQATKDCTQPDPTIPANHYFQRDVYYQLVDLHNNNVVPSCGTVCTNNYTVYEKLSYKALTACMKNGSHTGESPCGPVSGGPNDPYNAFPDLISLFAQSAPLPGIFYQQSFFYQLPGQRWWPVYEIDRWGGPQSNWIEPVVTGSYLNLYLLNNTQPLINNQGYPYMAPAIGTSSNCKGQPPSP